MEMSISALGHKRTLQRILLMSALPPKADMVQHDREGRFVPEADFDRANMLRLGRFNSER